MALKLVRNLLNSKRRGNNYELLTNNDDSKPQEKKNTEIVRSENDQITIEEIFARFPDLSECIFIRLDDRSLASCREVNKTWKGFVDIQRIYWIRKTLRYANPQSKFHGEWKMSLDKTPIEFLKRFAAFVWIRPEDESCPLFVAGALGDIELFNEIKEKTGLDENSKNSLGDTPFHVAATNNRLSLCEAIIEKLQDKHPRNNLGVTPLHQAAYKGHLKVCQLIMDKVDDKNPKSNSGWTPLHAAAGNGQLDVCKFLCTNLQEKNPKDENGRTPLNIACSKEHWKVVHFLIVENNLH